MAAVYPHRSIATPVLNKQVLQHDVIEYTNTALLDLLAHWTGDFSGDVLDGVAPTRTLMASGRLGLDTAITGEKRRPPGHEFFQAGTGFGGQSPHHGLMIYV
jgi:hypothetical protein